MSEYQYYQFAAIDRPLTEKEMDQLRSCSSRATITPTSFSNVYNYGDLKADPSAWDLAESWKNAEEQAARGTASGYEEAKRVLVELADAYDLKSSRSEFDQALRKFVMRNSRRTALMRRLVDAGLWDRE